MTKVLDFGYIELVEVWGSDERIIEAARMSTNKGFTQWEDALFSCPCYNPEACPKCKGKGSYETKGDKHLLSYLYKNGHMTPFEMAGCIIEVQAPIFVFREWHRHRTQSYNEMSARYTPLPDVNYMPEFDNIEERIKKATTKQAVGIKSLDTGQVDEWLSLLDIVYLQAETVYKFGLDIGIPKELARLSVPVGRYSKMRASANLRNWLQFLELRQAPNAQWEIRQYADALHRILMAHFPYTMALFQEKQNEL